jgi:hypothetical protein
MYFAWVSSHFFHIIFSQFLFKKKDKEKPSSEDDEIVETLQGNIVCRTKIKPLYINPKNSSYTRSRKDFLTKSISIKELISSECCQKNCLKRMDYMYALNKRKTYLAMNKSMKNSYLTGCMISTNTVYDYRIGNILLCRKAFKNIHSIGNFVYQESRQGWKNIHHFIQKYIMDERVGHS